jgi:hypothetical protein
VSPSPACNPAVSCRSSDDDDTNVEWADKHARDSQVQEQIAIVLAAAAAATACRPNTQTENANRVFAYTANKAP